MGSLALVDSRSAIYVLLRLIQGFAVLALAITVVFLVGHVIGDPVDIMLPEEATLEQRALLRAQLGFDQPLGVQFVEFLRRAATGFGDSLWQNRSALSIVLERLPATLFLGLAAAGIAIPVGLAVGTVAAFRPGTWVDRVSAVFSLGGVSVVEFWLALMLVLVFAVNLGWFPTGGYGLGLHLVLPAVAISYRSIGRISQLTRGAVLEEYGQQYVEMARAKGLSEWRVFRHVARNAAVGVIILVGDEVATMVNGAIVIEVVFSWPGVGSLLLASIQVRDLFLVEAAVFVVTAIVISANLVTDIVYAVLEPRVAHFG